MLHDPKTVIGGDFDQETAEKIAPPFIARLELANCSSRVLVKPGRNVLLIADICQDRHDRC